MKNCSIVTVSRLTLHVEQQLDIFSVDRNQALEKKWECFFIARRCARSKYWEI